MIRYISTRGSAPILNFEDTVLAGLANDGGLYVPDRLPRYSHSDLAQMAELSYSELALHIIHPFVGDAMAKEDLAQLINESYSDFRHPAIAPLVQLNHNEFVLELFHGPTLAFKDFALQFLGRLLEYFITRSNARLTIIGATSGDTGSAAIAGCQGRKNMRIFILHPAGRVSEVQRRQMTTVVDDNVYNIAVDGSFDDCQDIVKTLFAHTEFREKHYLTAVNSINWARILAQVVYYFYAAFTLGAPARAAHFTVPTGNFGDIFAGYLAKRMGLPMGKLTIATNSNDILARCLKTGTYSMEGVSATLSPSMDIQVSSNFERLLFDLYNRDGEVLARLMQDFRASGSMKLSDKALAKLREEFTAGSADDAETLVTTRAVYEKAGYIADPHTAVGIAVARAQHTEEDAASVILATAHPAKFPDAVEKAINIRPVLPSHLSDLMGKPEKMHSLPARAHEVLQFIESHS